MILNITKNNKTISIHCESINANVDGTYFFITGVCETVKKAIVNIGCEIKAGSDDNTILVKIGDNMNFSEQPPRTKAEVKVSELAIGEIFTNSWYGLTLCYEGDNKGFYEPHWGKETIEFKPDDKVKPYMNIPFRDLKIRLHRNDSYYGMEIWQSEAVPSQKTGKNIRFYLGRDFDCHDFSYLSDAPNGYCEKDFSCGPHLNLIVCDQKWNELFRTGNNYLLYPETFPSLRKTCQTEWESIKGNYPNPVNEYKEWINTFRPEKLNNHDGLNWDHSYYKNIDPDFILEDSHMTTHEPDGNFKTEILHTFTWMTEEYHIIRYAHKHTMCDARWYVYMAVALEKGKVAVNVKLLGYELDIQPKYD